MEGIPRQYTKRKKEAKRTSNKKRKKDTQLRNERDREVNKVKKVYNQQRIKKEDVEIK